MDINSKGLYAKNWIRQKWLPAVSNHGSFRHWKFIEIVDPWWDAKNTIRKLLPGKNVDGVAPVF